jgi:predicted RNA binding protein with dsRBD fold (UPF0201 family)
MIKLDVSTKMFPTEEMDLIRKMITHLYDFENVLFSPPDADGVVEVSANAEGPKTLFFLFSQTRREHIVEAVRNWALAEMIIKKNTCEFDLNKQALMQGYIALSTEPDDSPLGPVHIRISANKIEPLINYLFAHTEKGKVIEVDYVPTE